MRIIYLVVALILSLNLVGQNIKFNVQLEALEIQNFGGIQSFAFAQIGDEILILGGRLDGLHRRQPFAAFDLNGNNNEAIVLNPKQKKIWRSSYSHLPSGIKEQLSSTNMQFYQEGQFLLLIGGYAYSETWNDHITFPNITIVDVQNLISEIKSNSITSASFIQQTDQYFAITGGQLDKIEDTYYLVGGHRFDGRYNPMGPNHGPGFEQQYSHEIRKFKLDIGESEFSVTNKNTVHDELHLRRRDYNLHPYIRDGEEGLMVFSGVFQNVSDLPWLYPLDITSDNYYAIESFTQLFNHYHCASIPIYSDTHDEMHNLFFGGIAQFYLDEGILVQDNDVSFVNTISDVIRKSSGEFLEVPLTNKMPALIGAGSEFIIHDEINTYANGVIVAEDIKNEPLSIGYLIGGIKSSARNIFFSNEGSLSEAHATIYEVFISTEEASSNLYESINERSLLIYPNPGFQQIRLALNLNEIKPIEIRIQDRTGRIIQTHKIDESTLKKGRNYINLDDEKVTFGMYLYTILIGEEVYHRWVNWNE